ncbi:acyl-CoA dehydrogenase family protein [Nocardioides albus]|uniref:Acyl-CoA dehydrogenase n=1 Tax=Nocardioides albus TaxID=1841 RepID=A0A7W5A2W5_9ACTN|nr:acyl-CoA dehydrogenase family protein [Nocardioides albus]MBB3088400.1 acyl-CoA dehydrogenase [Nocardioides albus]GGU16031.1 acyl-CoA dehydrogenase [Nocardioides albus]
MEPDEFTSILDAVRAFVRKEVVPAEDEIEETDQIPDRLRQQAAAMGLFGYAIPEEYGGLGVTMSEEVRLAMELGWTTPSFRSMFGTNNGIAGQVLVNCGTERQKQRYLPGLASGELVASFALTEPEAGSDPSGLRTRAVRSGDEYVLDGQKRFITNAAWADLLMVFARTGDLSEGARNISVFVVPTDTPGVTVGPRDHKMGQRGTSTSEIFLDGVRVPAENLVGEVEGEGFSAAMRSLAKGRLHIAAMTVGLADRLIEESLRHATTNGQGGQKLAEFQLIQAMLAESRTEAYAGRAMVLEAARSWDDGSDRRMAPSLCKLFCSEAVDRIADRAVQIHGGLGYMREVPVERFYRDARLFRLYEGTSEIQKLIIAKQMVKDFHG